MSFLEQLVQVRLGLFDLRLTQVLVIGAGAANRCAPGTAARAWLAGLADFSWKVLL